MHSVYFRNAAYGQWKSLFAQWNFRNCRRRKFFSELILNPANESIGSSRNGGGNTTVDCIAEFFCCSKNFPVEDERLSYCPARAVCSGLCFYLLGKQTNCILVDHHIISCSVYQHSVCFLDWPS